MPLLRRDCRFLIFLDSGLCLVIYDPGEGKAKTDIMENRMNRAALVLSLAVGLTAVGSLIPGSGESQKKKVQPIEAELDACMEKHPSTAGMRSCLNSAKAGWDAELNGYYKRLMKRLPAEDKKRLREAQRAWMKYRDAEFKVISAIIAATDGTMWQLTATEMGHDFVKERANALKGYHEHWMEYRDE